MNVVRSVKNFLLSIVVTTISGKHKILMLFLPKKVDVKKILVTNKIPVEIIGL